MTETNIEAILINSQKTEMWQSLTSLDNYMQNAPENLTLDQYKRVRYMVDDIYRPNLSQFKESLSIGEQEDMGLLSKSINQNFADYLTDQHYRLMDEHNIRHNDPVELIIPKTQRGVLYTLERLMWGKNKNEELEGALIERVPETGLSTF